MSGYSSDPTQYRGFDVIEDPAYGFRRLDPIPPEAEIAKFYESQYYDLVRQGNRAPELQRLMKGGAPADQERQWLQRGLHTDLLDVLENVAPGRRLLEVGCGTGDFLLFARERGFTVEGTEPAIEAAQHAAANDLIVHASRFSEFVARYTGKTFDAVVMLNVLEHVPDPVGMLQECRQMLNSGGIVCIRVPNDFSEIQKETKEKLGTSPWWIAVPDHINYFNFDSLHQLLDRLGFETIYAQSDFPMEMFLLMGENYIKNSEVGSRCHARRVQFDLALSPKLRRKIYSALATCGVGRDCLVFGKMLT